MVKRRFGSSRSTSSFTRRNSYSVESRGQFNSTVRCTDQIVGGQIPFSHSRDRSDERISFLPASNEKTRDSRCTRFRRRFFFCFAEKIWRFCFRKRIFNDRSASDRCLVNKEDRRTDIRFFTFLFLFASRTFLLFQIDLFADDQTTFVSSILFGSSVAAQSDVLSKSSVVELSNDGRGRSLLRPFGSKY